MDARELRALRKGWGLSQRGLAEVLETYQSNVQRWETGTPIPRWVPIWLRAYAEELEAQRPLTSAPQ